MKLIFATGNKGKLREAREILPEGYELMCSADAGITEDIPETGNSFRENSLQKAEYIWNRCHLDCFSDDSGLEVDALGGAPGIYSARYAGEGHDFEKNIDKLLAELDRVEAEALAQGKAAPARTARFRCVVTLMLDGEPRCFEGTLEGHIARSRSGKGGFGYDPVFVADQYPRMSLAEVSEEEKNAISHRGQALRAMAAWLKTRN